MTSWIDPEEVPVRDDGADEVPAVLGDDGNEVTPAVPARPAWPKGVAVYVKATPLAGDVRDIRQHTNRSADGTTEYLWYQAGLATIAAMVTRVEGAVFEDRDGKLLQFAGSFDQRMAAAARLPQFVQDFTIQAINERSVNDPLGLRQPGSVSRKRSR
jgi:hypothetical protein